MSVTNSEISPPETDDYVNCADCKELTFVDELTDGVCGKCLPCGECGGEGCDECIEEVPITPRLNTDVAMDNAALSISELCHPSTKHLIREQIARHMEPELKKVHDAMVMLCVKITEALGYYAATTGFLNQRDALLRELIDTTDCENREFGHAGGCREAIPKNQPNWCLACRCEAELEARP